MIHLEASFTLAQHHLLPTRANFKRKNPILSLCKSNHSTHSDPEGDPRKQELLSRIAMLQTQKYRLTEFLDERATYLTQFAEEANAEIDQIGENALKELDQAGARIMGNMENQMQAFEESAEVNRVEIEENERLLADFEGQIEKGRNEGLFFKSLTQRTPEDTSNAGSKTRRNIYLALIGVAGIGLVEAFISSPSSWQSPTILGIISVGLLSQIFYEQRLISQKTREEKK